MDVMKTFFFLMMMIRAGWDCVCVCAGVCKLFTCVCGHQAWNICTSKEPLSAWRKKNQSLAVLADVTGGNVSVCDWDKRYHKVTLSLLCV